MSIESIEAIKREESKDKFAFRLCILGCFANAIEKSVKVDETVDWEHFAIF